MYVHQQQLTHLLQPTHYRDQDHYQRELEAIMRPSWQVVANTRQLRRPGDYCTFELFGEPVLLRNIDGVIHGFQNVCAHRHCRIVGKPRGSDERFRCQYHGWEYNADGRTARIPDAGCFRPWDRENAHLIKYRVETLGEMVFLSMSPEGPSLREHLGHFYDEIVAAFQPPFRHCWTYDREYPVNWKVPVENTLEGYHIECVHPKTFKEKPVEQAIEHILEPWYTRLKTPIPYNWTRGFQNWLVRRLGRTPESFYIHNLIHPNLAYITLDVSRSIQMFIPTSVGTCRHLIYVYSLDGPRKNPLALLSAFFLRYAVSMVTKQVVLEDVSIFEEIQKGLQASQHRGVIGSLEERIYRFQKYLQDGCDQAEGPAANGRIPVLS